MDAHVQFRARFPDRQRALVVGARHHDTARLAHPQGHRLQGAVGLVAVHGHIVRVDDDQDTVARVPQLLCQGHALTVLRHDSGDQTELLLQRDKGIDGR